MEYMLLILPLIIALGAAEDKEIWPVPTECPKVDSPDYTVHIRHESNCSQFYTCAHGNRVLTNCSDILHFNPVLQVCDWPVNANCLFWQTSTTTTTTPVPTPSKVPTTVSTTTAAPKPPADRDPECPWPDPLNETVHLPHETDCTKFYKCDHGKKVIFDCPGGLHFNKDLQVCDWPDKAGCDTVSTPSSTSSPTTTTRTTTVSTTTAAPKPPADRDPECPWPDPLNETVHLPHETDCTKFYKCDHGKKVIFDCPGGLHFNKDLQVCDWPDKAGCDTVSTPSSTSSPTTTTRTTTVSTTTAAPKPPADRDPECPWPDPLNETVHLPQETDCTKFYKCDHGKKVIFDCPDGLHFNKDLQVCDWPDKAGCDTVSTPSSTSSPTTTTRTTTVSTTTAAPKPPADRDPECPWPDPLNETVHLPHETDCTKFYKCDHGKKVIFDCPGGLHFNKDLQVCDWPDKAGCDTVSTPSSTSSPTTTTRTTTVSTTTAAPKPPADRDPECPWPDPLNETVHLPHETDCTKFYKCDHGKKVIFDCPGGLHFNKDLQVCDWPDKAGCDTVSTPSSTSSPTTTTRTTTVSTTTAAPKPPADRDPECPWPDPLNETVHLPHETDCTKFYKCDHGKKVIFDCPDGLHFNKDLQVCDWPDQAGCDTVSTPSSTSSPTTTTRTTTVSTTTAAPKPPADRDPECPWPDPLNETVHLPHETDCTKFYKCDHGKKVIFDCPDGLHFNKDLQVCDWPDKAGCDTVSTPSSTSSPTTTTRTTTVSTTTAAPKPPADRDPECPWPDPLNETVHLPHETDCTKFYKCDHGKKVIFDCPDGLHFNKDLQVCDWPDKAGCDTVSTPSSTSSPTTTTRTTTVSTTPAAPTPPADKSPDCPWPDPLNGTIYLPHECDCDKYYICDDGKKVVLDCPEGLHFRENKCVPPEEALCTNVTTISTTTSTTTIPTTITTTLKPTKPGVKDECDDEDLIPSDCDCSRYFVCVEGSKVAYHCEDDLYFNEEIGECDLPENVKCIALKL